MCVKPSVLALPLSLPSSNCLISKSKQYRIKLHRTVVWVVAGGLSWSLPQPSYSLCHVPVGLSGKSLHKWIIRIIIRKVIRSPLSSIAVMRPLGHPRNEFNLPWSSPLDEPWRCRHDPSVLNTSTSLLKGLHKIFNLF